MTHFDEYSVQADANTEKPAAQLTPGDFVFTTMGGGKDCNFTDFIDGHERWHCGTVGRLCKIVEIIDVAEDAEILTNWLAQPAPAHRGGSQSDDVADDKESHKFTSEDWATFYDLVTVYRKPSGKWLAVDCQGYEYWRYVHLPMNYDAVFADEYAAAVAALDAKEAAEQARKEAELAAHAAEYEARENELRAKYSTLKENPADGRQVGANVRKFLKMHFPGVPFKVSARVGYWGNNYDVTIEAPKDTPEEVRQQIRTICSVWSESLKIGKMDNDNDGYGEYEASRCPMNIFGNINYGIRIDYWLDTPYTVTETPKEAPKEVAGVRVVDYSEKAVAVVGNTRKIKEQLKAAGGRFNPRLTCGTSAGSKKIEKKPLKYFVD